MSGLRAMVLEIVRAELAQLAALTTLSTSSATRYEQVAGLEQAATDPEVVHKSRRVQHYGLSSRPASSTEVVQILCGGGNNRLTIAEHAEGGPADQAEGEVELWATFGQRIILRENGDVVVIPKAGQKILLGSAGDTDCDPVITQSAMQTVVNLLQSKIDSHVHTLANLYTGGGVTVTSTAATIPLGSVTVTGSPVAEAAKP